MYKVLSSTQHHRMGKPSKCRVLCKSAAQSLKHGGGFQAAPLVFTKVKWPVLKPRVGLSFSHQEVTTPAGVGTAPAENVLTTRRSRAAHTGELCTVIRIEELCPSNNLSAEGDCMLLFIITNTCLLGELYLHKRKAAVIFVI